MQVNSKKNKAFQYLDANASVLNRAQLIQGLVDGCGLTVKTATSYVSAWRKSNGVQRKYVKRTVEETVE